ncbi:PAS domain-containing protein, partial [Acinetobacter baumannii]
TYFAEAGVTILQRAQMLWQAGLVADESLVLGLMPARGRMRRGEGEARHFEFKYHPQRTADGHIERVIMVARDVTEE